MIETSLILNLQSQRSLVILDEIGRGTSTYDGVSIAWAIVEYIHNHPQKRAKTLFATHYHELTQLADLLPGVRNYNVAVSAMDHLDPLLAQSGQTQVDDPPIGQASRDQQSAQALRIGQMTFMEVKTATFLIREEGFDAKAFFVPVAGFIRQGEIGDQKDGRCVALLPPGNHRDRAIAFLGKPNIRNTEQVIRLNEQVAK